MTVSVRSFLAVLLTLATLLPVAARADVDTPSVSAPIQLASADTSRFLPNPDSLIGKTLLDIRANRMDDALREVNKVISLRPDFKLAHLIRGDLLMARAKPLSGLGAVPAAPSQSISDLRDEARVRLLRYLDQPGPDQLPRQILQLSSEYRHALLADASRARLYLFENVGGEPRLIADYYMTIGRNGTDKRVEGDKRTPKGVYRISDRIPPKRLTDFYGAGAFPLNYPNDWDRHQKRGGHGIWLHGVPSDTYSRPPRSSDGCVVVANPDLKELSRWIKPGQTPIVIVDRADWIDRETWEQTRAELLERLHGWRNAWETRAADDFFQFYASSMTGESGRGWATTKRRNILDKAWIRVELSEISLFLYPDDMAYTEFRQNYASDKLGSHSRKQLFWRMEAGDWRIALEKAQDTPSLSNYAQR
jgi:murein L,D-transpeptidase YafK